MTRDQAYNLVKPRFSNKNLFKHVLAVEAVMRQLAIHFNEDVEEWGLAGLLHDLDYEETVDAMERHTLVTAELLKDTDVSPEIIHAIKAHNNLAPLESLMDKALYAADPVTGLIVAATLMHPDKKLKSIETEFVLRRFKMKSFARGANRDQIRTCENIGLSLDDFLTISIRGMCNIDKELGL
jgi:putative nucleotidyltransferase with HDIG domain